MIRLFSILVVAMLSLNIQLALADNSTNAVSEEDFDFTTQSSQYLTDEQLQAAQEVHEIEDNSGFEAKIINSSHFSSSTATKTYIPINKVQK